MSPIAVGVLGVAAMLTLMLLRMPIGFAMAVVGFVGMSSIASVEAGLNLIGTQFYASLSSYTFTVLPLFVFMGFIAFKSGITKRLYDSAYKLMGSLPGGLAMASIAACAGFSAICGSTTATAATIGTVAIPEMKKYSYDPGYYTGAIAAGGLLGVMIPPSLAFIVYGSLTEQSIAKLFVAGILPGLVLATLFMGVAYTLARLNPALAPRGPRASLREKLAAIPRGGTDTMIIFGVVMGGMFAGVFAPTEAAAVGVAVTFLIALSRRELTWKGFKDALLASLETSAMLYVVIAGAMIFGRFIALSKIGLLLGNYVADLQLPSFVVLWAMVAVYLVLGCLMDTISMILITLPIFFPMAMQLGYDPIWFGVVIVIMMEMGAITPPVGINVFVVSGLAKDVPTSRIFKGVMPYVVALLILLATLEVFPQIALFLPSLM